MTETNLWTLVERDPTNPHFWTELVQVSEESGSYDAVVLVYRKFLDVFPLMHLYWNKLALVTRQKTGNSTESTEIFNKALSKGCLYYSVEMWTCYCDFVKSYPNDFSEEKARSIFEEAITAVGSFYDSDSLWSMYINWEETAGRKNHVAGLYARVLSQPVRNLEQFWNSFLEFMQQNTIEYVNTREEYNIVEKEVTQSIDSDEIITDEEIRRFRHRRYYAIREEKYHSALSYLTYRLIYEMKIQRSYFHFQLPKLHDLANWSEYLSFEISSDNNGSAKLLFERCLIPCALYPEFWIRYAKYMLTVGGKEEALSIIDRADKSVLGRDQEFQRLSALFLESIEEYELAQKKFSYLMDLNPDHDTVIATAIYHLRNGRQEQAVSILQSYIETDLSPEAYTAVAATLHKIGVPINIQTLITKCTSVPLALALAVSILHESKNDNAISDLYSQYLFSPDSEASLEDKRHVMPIYINHLRTIGAPIEQIREAQKKDMAFEKDSRLQVLSRRKEITRESLDLSETLEKWISYLKECVATYGGESL